MTLLSFWVLLESDTMISNWGVPIMIQVCILQFATPFYHKKHGHAIIHPKYVSKHMSPLDIDVYVVYLWCISKHIETKFSFLLTLQIIELNYGKIYRKILYLMVKTMVSCRFSLKPIQWTNARSWLFRCAPLRSQNPRFTRSPACPSTRRNQGCDVPLISSHGFETFWWTLL